MMSWTHQVWHLFRKDVREQQWMLGFYGVVLFLGMLQGIEAFPTPLGSEFTLSFPMSLVVRGLAFMIAGAVVLADSPHDVRAFWATLPYSRSAVWAAKVAMLAVLLLAALAALVPPLLHFSPTARQLASILVSYALSFGAILAASLLVATTSQKLRALLLVVVGALTTFVLTSILVSFLGLTPPPTVGDPAGAGREPFGVLLGLTLALAGAAYMYHVRRRSLTKRASALLVGVFLVTASIDDFEVLGAAEVVPPQRISGILPAVRRQDEQTLRSTTQGIKAFTLEVDGDVLLDGRAPSARVELFATSTAVLSGGVSDRDVRQGWTRVLFEPPLPLGAGVRWIDSAMEPPRPPASAGTMSAFLEGGGGEKAAAIKVGPAQAEGWLEFRLPELLARVRVDQVTSITRHGWQIRVAPRMLGNEIGVSVDATYLLRAPGGQPRALDALNRLAYLLENGRRGEAIRIYPSESRGSVGASWLAPRTFSHGAAQLSRNFPAWGSTSRTDEVRRMLLTPEWLADAELVIYEWQLTAAAPIAIATEVASGGDDR